MVHALERASKLVRLGGIVVVVHDGRTPPSLELHQGTTHSVAGRLHDHEGFPMVRLADQAVDSLIDTGQLALIKHNEFTYRTRIASYAGFLEWLDKQWDTSYLPERVKDSIEAGFLKGDGETFVIVHRQARIRSLKVV
jgi:hypothetical protein